MEYLIFCVFCCRQGKDWCSLRRPISKYMLTPGVVKDYNSEFNSISRDFVSYVQRQKSGPNGDCVLQDSATSFFKLTHECKLLLYHMLVYMYIVHTYLFVSNLNVIILYNNIYKLSIDDTFIACWIIIHACGQMLTFKLCS